jgi:hypothetical protein
MRFIHSERKSCCYCLLEQIAFAHLSCRYLVCNVDNCFESKMYKNSCHLFLFVANWLFLSWNYYKLFGALVYFLEIIYLSWLSLFFTISVIYSILLWFQNFKPNRKWCAYSIAWTVLSYFYSGHCFEAGPENFVVKL